MIDIVIIPPANLHGGLQEEEVEIALRDEKKRCGKHENNDLLIFSLIEHNGTEIVAVVEPIIGGQIWYVHSADKVVDPELRQTCIEQRSGQQSTHLTRRGSRWTRRLLGILRRFLPI